MSQHNEKIIADLQSRLLFQEDAIDALNKTVAGQSDQISLLQQQLKYLHGQLREMQEQHKEQGHELPPHY